MTQQEFSDLLTVEEIGKYLRIGRSSAYNLVNQTDFPAIKIGKQIRAKKEDFLQWIDSRKVDNN